MSKVHFYLEIKGANQPVFNISESIISSLRLLAIVDNTFSIAHFLHKKNDTSIDITSEDSVEILAENILKYSLSDIEKYDHKTNPDVHYSRTHGFTFGLLFKKNEKKVLSLTFKLGSSLQNRIGTLSMDKSYCNDLNWHKLVLDSFMESNDVTYAAVRPDNLEYLEESIKRFYYTLGWITYFSNDLKISIPNNLEGIEYEFTNKGKYLILTRENISINLEIYNQNVHKLLSTMEKIALTVPEYSISSGK